jgi:biopolymer transport protein ExbD
VQAANSILGDGSTGSMLRRAMHSEMPEFDVTAMVDLVFMMNIYFLVTFVTVALGEIDLPTATHCAPLDAENAVVLTLVRGAAGRSVVVYVGDTKDGLPLADPERQAEQIQSAVEQGAAEGKTEVLLKAEKGVRLGDMFRVSTAAAAVEGMKLSVAVMEKEEAR